MPEFRSYMTVDLVDMMGDERRIMDAAKISTLAGDAFRKVEEESKKQKDPARFVRWLMREGHGSPFEHPILTFYLEVPVFVSRQVVKYRHTSINEVSGRYSVLDSVYYLPGFYRPLRQIGKTGDYQFEQGSQEDQELVIEAMVKASNKADKVYKKMIEAGIAREVSRMVLPVNTYSQMVVTANLREWLHFIAQRASEAPSHGQYEIAEVADKIAEHIKDKFPNVWDEFYNSGFKSV